MFSLLSLVSKYASKCQSNDGRMSHSYIFHKKINELLQNLSVWARSVANLIKHFTIVNYDTRVVIYDRKMFIRLPQVFDFRRQMRFSKPVNACANEARRRIEISKNT